MAEKVTKENAPRTSGIYTEDDGSKTLIDANGKEVKNPYVDMYLNPDPLGYNTIIKPTLGFLNSIRKDLGYAFKANTATFRFVFDQVSGIINEESQRLKMQQDSNQMVWSEKHNRYMSKYDLKIHKLIDIELDRENGGG